MVKLYSCDFETHLISNEYPNPKPICLSIYDGVNPAIILRGEDIPRFLGDHLGRTLIIAHNMKFEMLVTYTWYPELRPKIWEAYDKGLLVCTLVYERLIDNVRERSINKFDLATLVKHYFKTDISEGKKNPDAWRLRYHELENVPLSEWPLEAVEYSKQDSIWAYKIYLKQSITSQKYQAHTYSDFTLNLMASRGLLIDQSRVKTLEKEVIAKIKDAKDTMIFEKMYRIEGNKIVKTMSKLREYIVKNVKDYIRTPKGQVSTSSKDLTAYLITNPEDKILKAHLLVMEYEKVITSYIKQLKQADPIIRTSYKPVVTSGRTSSSATPLYPSTNIQQPPRSIEGVTWDVRNCYVPRPGFKLLDIDYAGLELASAAHQLARIVDSAVPNMLTAINKGDTPTDMHSLFAVELRNRSGKYPTCTYEEFVANKKKETYKEFRQLAKPINLGFPGGIGYDTMSTLLYNEGIQLGFRVLKEIEVPYVSWKDNDGKEHPHKLIQGLKNDLSLLKSLDKDDVRIKRVAWNKFQLVKDELILVKGALFTLYPELKVFLTSTHEQFIVEGKTKKIKNEFGEWETEPMYAYDFFNVRRDWATYTAACNGILMQTPSAAGAKNAVNNIVKYCEGTDEIFPLAFIHDEILFEVKDNDNIISNSIKMAEMMIDGMQSVLFLPRITVEAEIMSYWSKNGTGGWSGTFWKNPRENKLYSL